MFKIMVSIPAYMLCRYVKICMYFPLVNVNMAKAVYSNVFPTFYPWSFSFSGPASVCSRQNYAVQQIVRCGCSLTFLQALSFVASEPGSRRAFQCLLKSLLNAGCRGQGWWWQNKKNK